MKPSLPTSPLTLSQIHAGEQAVLLEVDGTQMNPSRLASLGFTPGVLMQMTQNYGRGPLVVTVRGTRVALGRHEAEFIFVKRNAA